MGVLRSTLSLLLSSSISRVANLISLTLYARVLGAEVVGHYFLFLTVTLITATVSDFGIAGALEKRVSEETRPEDILCSTIFLKIISTISVLLVIHTLLRAEVGNFIGLDVFIAVLAGVIGREGGRIAIFLLRGELQVEMSAVVQGTRSLFTSIVGILVVLSGLGVRELIWVYVLGWYLVIIFGAYARNTGLGSLNRCSMRSIYSYSKYNYINSFGGQLYSWFDLAVIGFFLTASEVAIYEYAWRISSIVLMTTMAVTNSVFPYISSWNSEENISRITSATSDAVTFSLFFSIPAFFGVLSVSDEILELVFGSEFATGAVVLLILTLEKILYSSYAVLSRSLAGMDRVRPTAYATLLTAIVNVCLNIVLVTRFGIEGAAVATTLSVLLNLLLHYGLIRSELDMTIELSDPLLLTVCSALMFALTTTVKNHIGVSNLAELAFVISLAVIVYGVMTYTVPTLRTSIWKQLLRSG